MIRRILKCASGKFKIIFGIFSRMDDIGNLVYILVFIIWFLYRTFGKGVKKPVKPASPADQRRPDPDLHRGPSESTPPPVTFEDVLRELTGAPPETRAKEPQLEEVPETYETDYYPEPEEEETYFEVLEPTIEIPTAPGPVIGGRRFKELDVRKKRISKTARAAVKMFRSPQGVRQAFLMKEIFDRKHF